MEESFAEQYEKTCALVLSEINMALENVNIEAIKRLLKDIVGSEDVFLIGVGRVMMALETFCKRLNHLGIKAHCVGDISEPAIKSGDLLIVASGSGESVIPIAIAKKAKEFNAKVVHIGSNPNGSVSHYCDYMVRIPVRTRLYLDDEIDSQQIMTTLFEQSIMILGDVISKMLIDQSGIDLKKLWKYHANLE